MPVYVALGDSMSIDDYAGGPGRGAAALLHRNRDADFPEWGGRELNRLGYSMVNLCRDGATSTGVLRQQLAQLPEAMDLVTVTMGGNDLMMAYGDGDTAAAVIAAVARTGDEILRRLRSAAGAAVPIVLTTVYDPSDGTGAVPGGGLPPWPEAPGLLRRLNTVLAELAVRHDALLADVHGAFLGHGSAVGDPGQPHPRPADRNLWYCGVIEPNAWGADQIRRVWWRTLTAAGVVD